MRSANSVKTSVLGDRHTSHSVVKFQAEMARETGHECGTMVGKTFFIAVKIESNVILALDYMKCLCNPNSVTELYSKCGL